MAKEKGKHRADTPPVSAETVAEEKDELIKEFTNVELTVELLRRGIQVYTSEIALGVRYKVARHNIAGYAVAVSFQENKCVRVVLEYARDGAIKQISADDVELETFEGEPVTTAAAPGGINEVLDITEERVELPDPSFLNGW